MPRSSTTFRPGQITNPKGRKPLPFDVVKLCRDYAPEAIQKQIEIVRMKSADASILAVQARCAENLINRGYGTAPATVTILGDKLPTSVEIVFPLHPRPIDHK
jgi:hypothetical protein